MITKKFWVGCLLYVVWIIIFLPLCLIDWFLAMEPIQSAKDVWQDSKSQHARLIKELKKAYNKD